MFARTAKSGPRAAVLGGWAVTLAALAFGPASSGTVAIAAETGTTPVAGATDGSGSLSADVAIQAPAGGAGYRAGVPVTLLGGGSAAGSVLPGTALRWTVLRRTGAVAEQVAEATGTEASFVPAAGSAGDVVYEVRLTATAAGFLAATAVVTMHAAAASASAAPLQDVSSAMTGRAFGIAGAVQFSGPVLGVTAAAEAGAAAVTGTARGLATGSRIQVALRRGGGAAGCRWWSRSAGRFMRGRCAAPRFITAAVDHLGLGRATWRASLGRRLPRDATLVLRIRDRDGAPVAFTRG